MRHTKAIIKRPGVNFANGITEAHLGAPNLEVALSQHRSYESALTEAGVEVTCLDADPLFPDSCFVEDCAVLYGDVAIITNPGHAMRQGETKAIETALAGSKTLKHINDPGTVDGGDILRVDDHFVIGLSQRTNAEGARQLARHLAEAGAASSTVEAVSLHLKTGLAYLGDGIILCIDDYAGIEALKKCDKIIVPESEAYAANSIRVNDRVFLASGFPQTHAAIAARGLAVVSLAMSEFQKMDGGLSCLSLLF